ncbi:LysM peptidoglycan-binding domain-containing protein [Streptococcus porci]|uniref:LysM peptidoglycan-binding domain-containing protein n=1 Tax=Streptococcus porci TaxID=502567 RepID=UPI0003FCFCB8|nr:LysM domain-containing protein [Streptococcus porci]
MKLTKKTLLASSTAVTFFSVTGMTVSAQEAAPLDWTPRTVAEIKADAAKTSSSKTYTIQSGDTLSTIAAATGVDMYVLAQINQISNLDLIFPDTVLKLTYDANNQVTAVEVTAPVEATTDASVVETSQVAPVSETTSEAVAPETEVPTTVAETTEETTEASAVETSQAAPVNETTSEAEVPETETPTTVAETTEETTEASVVETSQVAPVSETTSEAVAPETEAPTTAAETTEEITEAPVVETTTEVYTVVTEVPTPVTEATTQTSETTTATVAATPSNVAVDTTGLQASAASFKKEIASVFGISNIGGYRPGDSGDHGSGNAIDVMVPVGSDLGDAVAQYAIDTMGSRNISYIIWEQKFYSPWNSIYGPAYTWNPMPDRGSITQNHYDHVHISFNN